MMTRPLPILAIACAVVLSGSGLSAWSQPALPAPAVMPNEKRSISAIEAVRIIEERWEGDILSVEIGPARPREKTDFAWSVRLLTKAGALVVIRLDAASGAYLGAEGAGLVEARRLPAGN